MIFAVGATSQSMDIQIVDDTGLAVTGLVAATFPTLTYSLAGPNADVAFPALSDLALITTAYASGGVKERGNGVYRLDVPNGVFTTAGQVKIRGEASGKHVLIPWIEVEPSVNVNQINAVSTSSVTTVNANQGTTQPLNFTGTGASALVQVDTRDWLGTVVATPATAGIPDINVKNYNNVAATTDANNLPKVDVEDWKANAVLTAITAGVPVVDWTPSPAELTGTATASAASTITLGASASATANFYNGMTILITSGTGKGQSRIIQRYSSGRVATVSPAWTTTPASTATYIIFPVGSANLETLHVANSNTGLPLAMTNDGQLDVNVIAWTGSVVTQSGGLPDVNVKAMTANVITAASINAGALNGKGDWLLASSAPTNFSSLSIDASGRVDLGKWIGVAPNALAQGKVDSAFIIRSGTAQAGSTGTTIVLDAGASATNNLYNNCDVSIVSGTGAGQCNTVASYVGSTKTATMVATWATTPDNTSVFVITPFGAVSATVSGTVNANVIQWNSVGVAVPATAGIPDVNVKNFNNVAAVSLPTNFNLLTIDASGRVDLGNWIGVAPNALVAGKVDAIGRIRSAVLQAGSATSATLDAAASATNDLYRGDWLYITNTSQLRLITAYDGTTKIATITPAWNTNPTNGQTFIVIPAAEVDLGLWANAVPNALISGRVDVTVGGYSAGQDPYTLVMKVAMTESYTQGAPTVEQALYELLQGDLQFSISGTTITAQKRDKTTTAMTWTIDSATSPTLRTRAT